MQRPGFPKALQDLGITAIPTMINILAQPPSPLISSPGARCPNSPKSHSKHHHPAHSSKVTASPSLPSPFLRATILAPSLRPAPADISHHPGPLLLRQDAGSSAQGSLKNSTHHTHKGLIKYLWN